MAYHLDFVRQKSSLVHPSGGWLGVDVFFVLSGYLITSLLVKEYDKRDRIRFGGFYARRALRLFPALAVLLVVVGLYCQTHPQYWWGKSSVRTIPWVIGYVINWGVALHHSNVWAGTLAHTWSLAVEEQFYLVWPLICLGILRIVRNRRLVAAGLLGAAALEVWWRYHLMVHGANFERLYNATDTHSDALLVGCALAFFVASLGEHAATDPRWRYASYTGAVAGVAAAPYLYLRADYGPEWTWLWIPACAVATALILFNLVTHPLPPLRWFLSTPPLVWVGKRSYGLYLWHLPVIIIVSSYGFSWQDPSPLYRANLIIMSLLLCALSYRYVEQPFLRWKERLSRRQGAPALAGPGGDAVRDVQPHPHRQHPPAPAGPGRAAPTGSWRDLLPQGYVQAVQIAPDPQTD